MCGIVGYVGKRSAQDVLLDGLEKLEYRGYDSAGVALALDGGIRVVKSKGRLTALREKLAAQQLAQSFCGIGHTRWATHGEPSDVNSHPHSTPRVSIVHNGIIENYRELIDEVGVDKFRERFEELQKTAMEFIEMAGFSETAYCNERILMQVILDYFMDVMRLKEFHSIERIRTEKLFAYTISWIVRRKPIQFRDYSEEERDIFINERFAAYLLINECLMCGTKHFVQEAYAEKLVEYTEMLLYYFKYRQCDPKTLELLIESFKMGGLVH